MVDTCFEKARALKIDDRIRQERGSYISTRDWNSYPFIFNLLSREKGSWAGKWILDVGSGNKLHRPSDIFPGARVCAVDPEFGKEGKVLYNSAHECLPGIAQEIPYSDNTFDLVLSSHAIPQHITLSRMGPSVAEMLRVMKPDGEIRMAPCVEIDVLHLSENLFASGFEVIHTEKGTEGPITLIKASDDIKGNLDLKKLATETFKELMGIEVKETITSD